MMDPTFSNGNPDVGITWSDIDLELFVVSRLRGYI